MEKGGGGGRGDVPDNANEHCPGTQSEDAGKSDACTGCPNQQICATAPNNQIIHVSVVEKLHTFCGLSCCPFTLI